MHWKTKAKIQNAIFSLPPSTSYALYYWIQRHFGALRKTNPIAKFKAAIKTWKRILELGFDPSEKVFLEVGTGRVPMIPLAYWLMGAKSTITIDLNPYVKDELIVESLEYISNHKEEIQELFSPLLNKKRLDDLLELYKKQAFSTELFLEFCQIQYIAPGDAANTGLNEKSIDFHTSYNVYEHIPPKILKEIMKEGNRIISDNGLFINRIDYGDHFSYSDNNISVINFLQYSDLEWDKYAGNRYMYMNRLRHDDYLAIFETVGHKIILDKPDIDERALCLLKSNAFKLDEKYIKKSENILSMSGAWIATQKIDPSK